MNILDLTNVHKHADGIPILNTTVDVCRTCILGKSHKLPFTGHLGQADAVGDLVHSDIVGPLVMSFSDRFRYASTFMDDHSRYFLVSFLQRRRMLREVFTLISAVFFDLGGSKISKLHSDEGKYYLAFQQDLGVVDADNKSFSPPYTPELKIIGEMVNLTMDDAARALLLQAKFQLCMSPF